MTDDTNFSLRRIAVPAFGPSFLFGLGEGAILPVIALTVRQLGGSVALAALMVTMIGIGFLFAHAQSNTLRLAGQLAWGVVILTPLLVLFATEVQVPALAGENAQ